jgi:hypothetical protein
MTLDEKQEMAYLEVFVLNKIQRFSRMTFPDVLNEALGEGSWAIIGNLVAKGYIADFPPLEMEFTSAGHKRYRLLKKQKRADAVTVFTVWVIFGCSIVSVADIIWKHVSPESTPKTSTIQTPQSPPAKAVAKPAKLPDSMHLPKK